MSNFLEANDLLTMQFDPPRLQHWRWGKKFLVTRAGGYRYEIPIAELHSPAGVLKWLGQIREKTWANDEVLGQMVRAINHIVGDLRGLKSCGGNSECKCSTPVIDRRIT